MSSKLVSALYLASTFALCLGIVLLVLWGGLGLGFFLTVLLIEATFLVWLRLPFVRPASLSEPAPQDLPGFRASLPLQVFLAAAVLDLGLCYFLYDNMILKLLNFPVLFALGVIQYLLAARAFRQDWDRPAFWGEAILSVIVRPFDGLGGFGRSVANLFSHAAPPSESPATHTRRIHAGKILLGLLLAIPVLLVAGAILTAADPVFARMFQKFSDWMKDLLSKDLPAQLLVSLLMLPFAFSFLYSGRSRRHVLSAKADDLVPAVHGLKIDKTVLITFLSAVNLLYLAFAYVQLAYLTGAFSAALPEGMTYAEYARSGFFELLGISVLNLALSVLAVKATDRHGLAGTLIRIESLLLVIGSLVQWGSAIFRMKMYVDQYGLSQLRFFSTAFMCLILVLFAFVVVKEFRPAFPLFKAFAIAAVVVLLLVNHVDSDAVITRNNISHYHKSGQQIDVDYLQTLSSSAVPGLLELVDNEDKYVSYHAANYLVNRYSDLTSGDEFNSWQWTTVSRIRAEKLIEGRIEELTRIAADKPIRP